MKSLQGERASSETRRGVRFGGAARVWLLVGAITLLALAAYAVGVTRLSPLPGEVRIPWLVLAVFFYLAEACVVHLHFRREAHTLSFNDLGIVLGLFTVTPEGLILAQLIGAGAALVLHRRQRPLKVAFNLAQFALSTCIALVVFHALLSLGDPHSPLGWVAALLAAGAAGLSGVLLVSAAISLAEGAPPLRELPTVAAVALIGTFANASLALASVELLRANKQAIWLLVVPTVSSALALTAYASRRRQHEHLEFLYQSMRSVQKEADFDSAVGQLLLSARRMFRAEFAEIVLLPHGTENAMRTVAGPHGETLMAPTELDAEESHAADTAASSDGAILLERDRKTHELDDYLAARELKDAMLAALRGEKRVLGMLLIANRSGDVSTFSADDRRLCETFASHASVLLENGRLAQSLARVTELQEELRHQAFHDALTGLPNRALFTDRVEKALARSAGTGRPPAVLFLDLDDFKMINDTLGHAAGDELLVAVADRLRGLVRPGDTAARLGGDEFAVLLSGTQGADPERIAARLVQTLSAPLVVQGREASVHPSIGVAKGALVRQTAEELLGNADMAMYAAKTNGKRRYAIYDPTLQRGLRTRVELRAALQHAVERGQLSVYYQPIVDLASGRPVAFEALARWNHPRHGIISPLEFIPLAEEAGYMPAIGRAIMGEACRQMRVWQEELPAYAELAISVNLSPSELQNRLLTDEVAAVLKESGLEAKRLILEITESGVMRDPDAAVETLRRLRALGVRPALDDFGTGYSSLSHLRDFPIDLLKIAKPFVDRLHVDPSDANLAGAILRLADSLGLDVVAEGIEHADQANTLRALGCAFGQGYHFAWPRNQKGASEYLRMLRRPSPLRRLPSSAVA